MELKIYSVSLDYIQGHSGGKGNIFGNGSVGHCERKAYVNVFLILNIYRNTAVSFCKNKGLVNGNKETVITNC
jgi:hypothetical protein